MSSRSRPGVKFSAWTFGDQVPGPTVRARVGDRIRFTHDQPQRRAGARRAADRRADDALDGLPRRHGVAAGQVPLDRARPDDRVRVHAQLPGRLHVPLRHADDPRAHRLGHVRRGGRRAARRLPDEGRPRVRRHPERVLRQARSGQAQGRRRAALRARRRAPARQAQPTYTVFNGVLQRHGGEAAAGQARRARAAVRAERRARARPRASTSSARSSTASGSTATPTTSSAACRRCCSARRTARSSSS